MEDSDNFRHPGKIFVAKHGQVTDRSGVIRYTEFLREESGLSDVPPINLDLILRHFGVSPRRLPLDGQSGLLLDPDSGAILINSDDLATRQRFTGAHELIEFLFDASSATPRSRTRRRSLFSDKAKEKLCEEGAAELLMPCSSFVPYLHQWGVSLETGKRLADLYNVSLTAALMRAVRLGPGQHALVLWRLTLKPREERALVSESQLSLFEDYAPQPPPPRLRVLWACSTQDEVFIPAHKSVEFGTSIYQCYEQVKPTQGLDWLDLASISGHCYCESMPIAPGEERYVLSVIHLPRDEHAVLNHQRKT